MRKESLRIDASEIENEDLIPNFIVEIGELDIADEVSRDQEGIEVILSE